MESENTINTNDTVHVNMLKETILCGDSSLSVNLKRNDDDINIPTPTSTSANETSIIECPPFKMKTGNIRNITGVITMVTIMETVAITLSGGV